MTFKTHTIVFAFAAMLMAMPLANSNAFGEVIDASLSATCGFTVSSAEDINFGAFAAADSAATVGEEDAVFPSAVAATKSARVQVTFADWFGTGTRGNGTITLVGAVDTSGDSVTVGGVTYDAHADTTSGTDFDISGDDVADAKELAIAIRDQGAADFDVSTAGTNVVTVNTIARGTSQNTVVLSEDTTGSRIVTADDANITTTNVVNGATGPQLIMDGETTKFTWDPSAAQTTTYAAKSGIITLGTAQEVLGGTVPLGNVHLAIMIDPASAAFSNLPYDGPLTQVITITVESACDGTIVP